MTSGGRLDLLCNQLRQPPGGEELVDVVFAMQLERIRGGGREANRPFASQEIVL